MARMRKVGLAVACVGGVAALVFGGMRLAYNRQVDGIWHALEATPPTGAVFTEAEIAGLPAPAQRYFRHAIRLGAPIASHVTLQMHGDIKPGGDFLPFTGDEVLVPGQGFAWRARVTGGPIRFSGADYFYQGTGEMRFFLYGVAPLVTGRGPAISRASAGRLAGELFWCPSGMLPRFGVRWEPIDDQSARAFVPAGSEVVPIVMTVAPDGRLLETVLQRYNADRRGDGSDYIPFGGQLLDEQTFGDYTIPTVMRAGWLYSTPQYQETFRFTITGANFQ